ncbi:hypothetical protein TSUD_160700 [Trifolium subterraneum]|uniref:Non-specific lipid-transfer protein n=1 Tax=Trifolium subterraneum TaxID=3900 RepID=A0A2Z6N1V3_TRISU|nr:hypothetical protein TSUD_160700 [Trifolium subterraneum]
MLIKVTCLAMICLVWSIPSANATLSCGQIKMTLLPCLGYVMTPGPPGATVPGPCCNGVRTVNDEAKTTIDRQDTCKCLQTLRNTPGANFDAVAAIPDKCGVNLPYKITPDIDCNSVKY